MYLVILIGLFILKANGIAIPNIAFILTFVGIGAGFLQGFLQGLTKQREQRKQETESLKNYFKEIAKA